MNHAEQKSHSNLRWSNGFLALLEHAAGLKALANCQNGYSGPDHLPMELRVTLRICQDLFTLRTSSPWHMSANYITDIQVSHLQMNTLESCWSCGRVPQEIDKKLCCQMNPHHHHILSFWHGHGMDTLLSYICTYEAMWIVLSLYSLSWTDRRSKRPFCYQSSSPSPNHSTTFIYSAMGDSIVFVVNHKA